MRTPAQVMMILFNEKTTGDVVFRYEGGIIKGIICKNKKEEIIDLIQESCEPVKV